MNGGHLSPKEEKLPQVVLEPAQLESGTSLWQDAWARLKKNHVAVASLFLFLFLTVASFLGPALVPYSYRDQVASLRASPPLATIFDEVLVASGERSGQTTQARFPVKDYYSLRSMHEAAVEAGVDVPPLDDLAARLIEPFETRREALGRIETRWTSDRDWGDLELRAQETLDLPMAEATNALFELRKALGYSFALTPAEKRAIRPAIDLARERLEALYDELAEPLRQAVREGQAVRLVRQEQGEHGWERTPVLFRKSDDWHLFGTDTLGRDLLARMLKGGQVSIGVGFIAMLVSLIIGVVYGATAGYFGGKLDSVMMRIVDILYAMPFTIFVILLMTLFERSLVLLFVAIGAVEWLTMARIVRGQVASLRKQEFIEAAISLGLSRRRIILRHTVPNVLGVVIVYATLTVPAVMLLEAFLSFLGLGVQPPTPSWGTLINDGQKAMTVHAWLLIIPAFVFSLTLFCLNFLGDGLRDALDPRSSKD